VTSCNFKSLFTLPFLTDLEFIRKSQYMQGTSSRVYKYIYAITACHSSVSLSGIWYTRNWNKASLVTSYLKEIPVEKTSDFETIWFDPCPTLMLPIKTIVKAAKNRINVDCCSCLCFPSSAIFRLTPPEVYIRVTSGS